MRTQVTLQVNGAEHTLPLKTTDKLLKVLREDLLLTGTKLSCSSGQCGACSVLVDGRAMNSCLLLAVDMEGHEITTIEGLSPDPGILTPLQQSFIDHGAIHCGFCTPGMIILATDYLAHCPAGDRASLKQAMKGNICRCTGYSKLVEAIEAAAGEAIGGSVGPCGIEAGR